MNVVNATSLILLIYVSVAAVWDLKTYRISNRLILVGYILDLMVMLAEHRSPLLVLWNISFPVILLYSLYLLHIIGAGDIKLFSVIGGFVNFKSLVDIMLWSFFLGAVLSLFRLILGKSLWKDCKKAVIYLFGWIRGKREKYLWKYGKTGNLIHFSVAIWLAVVGEWLLSLGSPG